MSQRETDPPRGWRARLARRLGRFLGVSDLFRSQRELRAELDMQFGEREALRNRLEEIANRVVHLERGVLTWVTTTYLENTPAPEEALITVVVPTHDRAEFVGRAVESVLAQSHTNWELIVVDDGSEDHTPEVLAGLEDPRIRVVRQENRGLSAARNTALAQATGRYVVYLDDDNVMHPHWLRAVAAVFDRQPHVDVAIGARIVDDRRPHLGPDCGWGSEQWVGWLPELTTPSFDRTALQTNNVADIQQVAHRRNLPEAHFDEELSVAGDWDLLARLTRERDPVVFPAISGVYRTSAPSRLMDSPERFSEFQRVRNRVRSMVAPQRDASEPVNIDQGGSSDAALQ